MTMGKWMLDVMSTFEQLNVWLSHKWKWESESYVEQHLVIV